MGLRLALALAQARGKPEGRTPAQLGLDPDLAAHQLGQALGDRQPESGAAIAARGRAVGLAEALEQASALLFAQADAGVLDREMQQDIMLADLALRHLDPDLALLGELDRVVAVIDQDLAQAQRITDQGLGQAGFELEDQFEPLAAGLLADQVGDVLEHRVELEVGGFDRELAGLDLREVQDVIDDAEQVLARALDLAEVILLARAQPRLVQQMGHADDRVHRGADLVAHVGQEAALGARSVLGQLACAAHFVGDMTLLGHVVQRPDHPLRQVVEVDRMTVEPDPELAAVLTQHRGLEPHRLAAADLLAAALDALAAVGIGEPAQHAAAHQFGTGAAQQPAQMLVAFDDLLAAQHDDAAGDRIEDRVLFVEDAGDRAALGFDLLLLARELLRLLLRGLEQALGPDIALENLEPHREHRQQALEQALLARPEQAQRGQLDHGQHLAPAQHGQRQDGLGRRLAQAARDPDIVGRRAGDLDRCLLERALADQAFAKIKTLRQPLALGMGILRDQAQPVMLGIEHVEHTMADLQQRTDLGQEALRQFAEAAAGLQQGRDAGLVRLGPLLLRHLLARGAVESQ